MSQQTALQEFDKLKPRMTRGDYVYANKCVRAATDETIRHQRDSRRRVLFMAAKPTTVSLDQVTNRCNTSFSTVMNVLKGFTARGVAGALAGQWIDFDNRPMNMDMTNGSVEFMSTQVDKLTDDEEDLNIPDFAQTPTADYVDPHTRRLSERFPDLLQHFSTTTLAVPASTAANVFADYVDYAIGVTGKEQDFCENWFAYMPNKMELLQDIVNIGKQYLAARGQEHLLTAHAGMLKSLIIPTLAENIALVDKLQTKVTANFAMLYICWRAVHDVFPGAVMQRICDTITDVTGTYVNAQIMGRAIKRVQSEFPDIDMVSLNRGEFVPGHINWEAGVMQVGQRQVIDENQVLSNVSLSANDARLLALAHGMGIKNETAENVLRALEELPDGTTVGDVAQHCKVKLNDVVACVDGYEAFGVVGALCARREPGSPTWMWTKEAQAPALQAAVKAHVHGQEFTYVDVQSTCALLGDLNEDGKLLRYLGDVERCGELRLGTANALYALAVHHALEQSIDDVDVEFWRAVLLANNCAGTKDVIPESRLTVDNLNEALQAFEDFLECETRADTPVAVSSPQPEPEVEPAPSCVNVVETREQVERGESADVAAIVADKAADVNDFATLRAQLNAYLDMVQQTVMTSQTRNRDNVEAVNKFVSTKVNGVNVLDFLNTVLAPFAWRLTCVDGELRPNEL